MSPLYAPLAAGAEDDDLIRMLLPEEVTVSSVVARAVGIGHHMLKVEGYSRLKHTRGDNGSPLLSGEFRAGGHTWKIRYYLDGAQKEDAGFISLYLSLTDPGQAPPSMPRSSSSWSTNGRCCRSGAGRFPPSSRASPGASPGSSVPVPSKAAAPGS